TSPILFPYTTLFRSGRGTPARRRGKRSIPATGWPDPVHPPDSCSRVYRSDRRHLSDASGLLLIRQSFQMIDTSVARRLAEDLLRSEEHTSELQSREN